MSTWYSRAFWCTVVTGDQGVQWPSLRASYLAWRKMSGGDIFLGVLSLLPDILIPSPPSGGSRDSDPRGGILERCTAVLDLLPENVSSVPTFAVGYSGGCDLPPATEGVVYWWLAGPN